MGISIKHQDWTEDQKISGLSPKQAVAIHNSMEGVEKDARLLFEKYPGLGEVMMDPKLSPHQKKLRALPFVSKITKERDQLKRELVTLDTVKVGLEKLEIWDEISHVLEKNDCSRLHKLVTAYKHDDVRFMGENTRTVDSDQILFKDVHPFVVQNDWAKAFENATDYAEGEINLPYNICVFEFRISGHTVIVLALQPEGESVACLGFVESNGVWFCNGKEDKDHPAFQLAWNEIRAICIALEAECAVHELTRAPEKLNRQREAEGKIPLYSYHVVKLSERHRASVKRFGGTHKSPRLHFRRGHWRHFSTHKTWIKWMLVGDPELGFVDKEYRL